MSMIERLQRALQHIEELSPAAQEDLAQFIEEITEPFASASSADEDLPPSVQRGLALAGTWRDLQDDDEIAFFDRT